MQARKQQQYTGFVLQNFLANTRASAQAAVAQIKHRLQRTTPRERVLIGCLIIGAALYAPFHALDNFNSRSEAYVEALSDQSTARLAAQSARRITSSAASEAALEDMKTWGFEAANENLAQVLIEQRLSAAAEKLELPSALITTQAQVRTDGPTHWMTAEVQTDLRWGPAFAYIDEITSWPEGYRMTGFQYEVRPSGPPTRDNPNPSEVGNIVMKFAFPVRLEEWPEQMAPMVAPEVAARR